MKFVLMVEGYTERLAVAQFLKRWLDHRLSRPVGIKIDRFEGYGHFWRKAPEKARHHLEGPQRSEIIAVIGLLDLYGPKFYPDHTRNAQERYEWGVGEMVRKVDRAAFRMFFAVHETEAWILSQPSVLPFTPSNPETSRMRTPEAINFREPPSALLHRLYEANERGAFKKTTHGVQLIAKIDPDVAYDKCPRLKKMLDEMLALAQIAGL